MLYQFKQAGVNQALLSYNCRMAKLSPVWRQSFKTCWFLWNQYRIWQPCFESNQGKQRESCHLRKTLRFVVFPPQFRLPVAIIASVFAQFGSPNFLLPGLRILSEINSQSTSHQPRPLFIPYWIKGLVHQVITVITALVFCSLLIYQAAYCWIYLSTKGFGL